MENKIVIPQYERNYAWTNDVTDEFKLPSLSSLSNGCTEDCVITGEERKDVME